MNNINNLMQVDVCLFVCQGSRNGVKQSHKIDHIPLSILPCADQVLPSSHLGEYDAIAPVPFPTSLVWNLQENDTKDADSLHLVYTIQSPR